MPKNKIEDLRNHLFVTLEALLDKDDPMELDRAKAVAQVSQVIINSAMAEVKALKVMGRDNTGTEFFPEKAIEGPSKQHAK